jgi:tyrosinase
LYGNVGLRQSFLGTENKLSQPQNLLSKVIVCLTRSQTDIEIHNVDHSGLSYEGRVFLNNPNANHNTVLTLENGYVGSYYIFGHGGCYGGMGHCDVPTGRRRRLYDSRSSHHLKPQYKRIIITNALKKLGKDANKFTITIVPVLYGTSQPSMKEIIKFDKIGIITYD